MKNVAFSLLVLLASNGALAQQSSEGVSSELDRLSRSVDDPFAGVIELDKREPVSVTLRALDKITARYTDIEIAMNEIARFGSLELQPRTCDKRPPEEFPETTVFLEVFDLDFGDRGSDFKIALPPKVEPDTPAPTDIASDEFAVEPVGRRSLDEIAADELAQDPEPVLEEAAPVLSRPAPIVSDGPQADGENIFRGWMFASSPALNSLEHPVYDVWVIDCKTRVVAN